MQQFRAVYLFDEFDSIGTTRNTNSDVGEIKRVLNSFLLQIEKDESKSLIIAATNMPESLDSALFRRFDDIISYPLPVLNEIEFLYNKLLSKHINKKELSKYEISNKSLGLSFSEIQKVCEDYLKHTYIYGDSNTSILHLIESIEQRKK